MVQAGQVSFQRRTSVGGVIGLVAAAATLSTFGVAPSRAASAAAVDLTGHASATFYDVATAWATQQETFYNDLYMADPNGMVLMPLFWMIYPGVTDVDNTQFTVAMDALEQIANLTLSSSQESQLGADLGVLLDHVNDLESNEWAWGIQLQLNPDLGYFTSTVAMASAYLPLSFAVGQVIFDEAKVAWDVVAGNPEAEWGPWLNYCAVGCDQQDLLNTAVNNILGELGNYLAFNGLAAITGGMSIADGVLDILDGIPGI